VINASDVFIPGPDIAMVSRSWLPVSRSHQDSNENWPALADITSLFSWCRCQTGLQGIRKTQDTLVFFNWSACASGAFQKRNSSSDRRTWGIIRSLRTGGPDDRVTGKFETLTSSATMEWSPW